MKKKLLFTRALVTSLTLFFAFYTNAAVFPYVTQLQSFGGTSADLATFTPIPGDYTLEVQGTVGVTISVAGGVYSYTPTTSGTVRFAQKNGVVYVYEGTTYMASITPDYSTIFPTIADANVTTDANNLLQNASFETPGSLVGGSNYNFGSPWVTNVTVASSGGIRIQNGTAGNTNGTWECVWRGTANSNYFAQPVATTIESNTFYKVVLRQIAGSNSAALFNIGLGSTVSGMEYGSKTILLANGKNGQYSLVLGTPASVSGTTYFTFKNTAANTATAGNQTDALTQLDYFQLIKGTFGTPGITNVSSATFLAGTAYSPEFTVNHIGGDSYDMTPYILNKGFDNLKGEWTESPAANLGGYSYSEVEYFSKTFNLSQAITGLPAGIYQLKVQGFERATSNDAGAAYAAATEVIQSKMYATSSVNTYNKTFNSLYSNIYQAAWGGTQTNNYINNMAAANGAFTAGYYDTQLDNIIVGADGALTIGSRKDTNVSNSWSIFDNYRLYYFGPVLDPIITAPQSSVSLTTTTNTAAIDLTGSNLASNITITVPSTHITLSGTNVTGTSPNYTIALANANATNAITATWDIAANVSGNISFTSGAASLNVSVTTSDVESVAMTGISLSAGHLTTAFDAGTTSYLVKAPADASSVIVTGVTNPSAATVTNNGTAISASSPSVVLTGNSYNGAVHTADYTVTWDGNYTFADWDANGITGVNSMPTYYGWVATPTLTWMAANTTSPGTVRYMDMVNGANAGISGITYVYNAVNYDGRLMFARWDGASLARVYSYPAYVEAGKTYKVTGKAAWNSNASAPTLTFKINTAKDNTGTEIASTTAVTGAAGNLVDVLINTFSVPTTGIYYLTVTSTTESLCALADLTLLEGPFTSIDGINNTMKIYTLGRSLYVVGADSYKVYNIQGVKVADVSNNTANTKVDLNQGAYIVKSNNGVQKFIVK